jgi:hypothetical protein
MLRHAMCRAGRIACLTAVIAASMPLPALAHRLYERLERVMMDDRGRELRLVLSYTDGIVMYDPVKLVVRSPDHSVIAETGEARTISVICTRPTVCVVFAYDEVSPLPGQIWWLKNGQLQATSSPWLIALGVVAPLWSDAWRYVVAVGFLLLPWPVIVILRRIGSAESHVSARSFATPARQTAVFVVGVVGSVVYYFSCYWMLMMVAELSPVLAIGSAVLVWGWIAFCIRAGRGRGPARTQTSEPRNSFA